MISEHVDPATVSVWRWHGAVWLLLLAFAATVFCVIRGESAWLPAVPTIAVAGFVVLWRWSAAYYRHLTFALDDLGIAIELGVLWRSHIALPRARIQHTDVSQGPLQRRFGVATLKLYTAGSRYTRIELPGLAHARALTLRDALLERPAGSGV